jgi:hypothetical protein
MKKEGEKPNRAVGGGSALCDVRHIQILSVTGVTC